MLGQTDYVGTDPSCSKELGERRKRNVWDDLIFATQLLKRFDEELKKLHPDVIYRIRQIMN